MNELSFEGRVAVITGAGRGIGRAYAHLLAARGACVVVNDLGGSIEGDGADTEPASAVAAEILAAGGTAIADTNDVSTAVGGEALIGGAIAAFGRVDALINNAGIVRWAGMPEVDEDNLVQHFAVHVGGSFNTTRAAWPHMVEQNYGRIVMTTSSSGLYGNFGQSNYGAAKLGLVGFMNTLKLEGAKNNIKVNTIAPVAATRMTENLGIPEEAFKRLKPELVTPAVLYLCSDEAPTGTIIEAGAGYYAKVQVEEAKGVKLGENATVEDIAANWSKISDMSAATPFNNGSEVTMKLFSP